MNFIEQRIKGIFVIEPIVKGDTRGYFMESYKQAEFDQKVTPICFVQDNEARSHYGVLRGLHFQTGEFSQAKLVRVIEGCVLDVVVDLRPDSPTLGEHFSIELSAKNKKQLFIPRHFAHGYVVLSDSAILNYKVDNRYAPLHEQTLQYNDPALGINWIVSDSELHLSEKDKNGVPLATLIR